MPFKRAKQRKDYALRIRLGETDYWRLYAYAREKDVTMTNLIENYIRKLPTLSHDEIEELIAENRS